MTRSEGEEPTDTGESRGSGSTDYEQLFADAKQEAATERGVELPTPAEMSQILNRADRLEVIEGMERENQRSLAILESGTNNTGVGNVEFARAQFVATLYATRGHTLDRTGYDNEGSTMSAQIAEELGADALREADMWERAAKGEPLTPEEENLVRGRALSIRKAAAAERVARGAEQPPAVEEEKAEEQTSLEQALEQIPDDSLERNKFGVENLEEFDESKIDLLKAYLIKEARSWAARVPEGARYPDSVAGILGNGMRGPIRFLGQMVLIREGTKEIDLHEVLPRKFSDVMRTYLDLDVQQVVPDFDKKFG